uniref:Uncharacterized protein n=1 Tax=Ditylenchus dipsaci TaxID=166011 RepID=A0A915E5T0_9BILA
MDKKSVPTKNILFASDCNSQMKYKIPRTELVQHVKDQLLCTLGSMSVGVTLPILMGLYRDDTDEEITELSQILGFPSLEAMLQSEEFEDVVACDFTENALGGGVGRAEKVFCYRVVPTERISHITKNICDAAFEKDRLAMQRDYKEKSQLGNPLFNAKIVEGIRLLTCIAKLNGEHEPVSVFDLQKEYYATYQVFLDKSQIFDVFCFNDVDVSTDVERNGSLYIQMKRPFKDIMEECKRVSQDQASYAHNNIGFHQSGADPSNGAEKYKPTLIPLNSKNENFFTNDRLLARKFGAMDHRDSSASAQSPTDIAPKFQLNQGYPRSSTCHMKYSMISQAAERLRSFQD